MCGLEGRTRVSGWNDSYSEVFDGDGHETQTGGALRKQLEETLAANKRLTERLDRLEQKAPLEALFKEKGIDPAAIGLVPAGTDPKEWLEQNARFLKAVEPPMDKKVTPAEPEVEVAPDPELEAERQQLEGLEGAGNTGIPSTATSDQIQKLQSFDNEADLLNYIQSGGSVG